MAEGSWRWLASTKELQETVYGYRLPMTGVELANYVTWNHSAGVVEFGELLDEFGWKPWANPRGWVNREAALTEAVDIAHFLANILCAIGVTDDEWTAAYQAKQQVNRDRQRDGYDGVTDKCPSCKRAFTQTSTSLDGATVQLKTTDAGCLLDQGGSWRCPVDKAYGADVKFAFGQRNGGDDAALPRG